MSINLIKTQINDIEYKTSEFKDVLNELKLKDEYISEIRSELEDMKIKYLNALAVVKGLKVVEYDEYYNILDEDGEIIGYSDDEFNWYWIKTFEEVEEFIQDC